MSSHTLEERQDKLEQLHRPVREQGHKLEQVGVLACRLVLGLGQVCRWVVELVHIGEQQRP
jgi:hypothetical protein